jgi:hypothetical protein
MNKNSFGTSNGLIVSSAAIKTFKTLSQEAILHIFLISESNHIYFCFCYCYPFIFFPYWLGDRQKSKTLSQEAILHIFLISESNHIYFCFCYCYLFIFFSYWLGDRQKSKGLTGGGTKICRREWKGKARRGQASSKREKKTRRNRHTCSKVLVN